MASRVNTSPTRIRGGDPNIGAHRVTDRAAVGRVDDMVAVDAAPPAVQVTIRTRLLRSRPLRTPGIARHIRTVRGSEPAGILVRRVDTPVHRAVVIMVAAAARSAAATAVRETAVVNAAAASAAALRAARVRAVGAAVVVREAHRPVASHA